MKTYQYGGENHLSASELAVHIEAITKLYPVQFITRIAYSYDRSDNTYVLLIHTSDEMYPGQMEGLHK